MNVIDKAILSKVLSKVFEDNSKFLEERKKIANLIRKTAEDTFEEFYGNERIDNKENKELVLLLNEFNKYKEPIIKNGFINETSMKYNIMQEDIRYEKQYGNSLFSIVFYMDFPTDELQHLIISSTNSNDETEIISFTITLENNKMEILDISTDKVSFPIEEDPTDKSLSFLESIKEEDLFNLNSKETEDIHLMLYDYSLNLSKKAIYEVFKLGLKDFQDRVKKELSQKNIKKVAI